MNCEQARLLVHALVDGELDASHTQDLEAHVATCAECAAELKVAGQVHKDLAGADLRYEAPVLLRRRIERLLPAGQARASRRDLLKGFGLGVGLSAVAASGLFFLAMRNEDQERLLGEVVSAHLRSLQADHLLDVQSTDQHTVKPWFNGRLDVAPPVVDLTAQGFTLIGGRLDSIDGKAVAAIVYRRRIHVINLFAVAAPTERRAAMMQIVQGFNIRHWAEQGVSLWAISDINPEELQEFGRKFEAALRGSA
jgi:anti-sigma factor RsiW